MLFQYKQFTFNNFVAAVAYLLLAGLVVAGTLFAGFGSVTTTQTPQGIAHTTYSGKPLTDAQKQNVQNAIDKLRTKTSIVSIHRFADLLQKMLNEGRICQETGNANAVKVLILP
ncbi:MAG: hypothetical protein ACKVS6_15275 [Planctomycetota bacterium]